MKGLKVLLGMLLMVSVAQVCSASVYVIDADHSSIGFSIRHLTVSNVHGQFANFRGTINYDPQKIEDLRSTVVILVKGINTLNKDRDEHLLSAEFFDVKKFPEILFKGKSAQKKGEGFVIIGDLTIHGVTKEIMIPVSIFGPIKSPMGEEEIIGLSGQTTINRQDFGINFNKVLDNGGLMIGNDVQLIIDIEAKKQL